jgi:dihydropteroate synthase
MSRPPDPIDTRHGRLDFSGRALVMGILNVTPDSFSDGGRYGSVNAAVEHGLAMAADGADLIDVGGESTRPGSDPVEPAEQVRRVVPVLRALRAAGLPLPISIDTRSAEVAAAALDAGADVINDVSALGDDPEMAPLAARRGAAVALMHRRGTSKTMQAEAERIARENPRHDVVAEIIAFLRDRIAAAVSAGIDLGRIVLDPGIGFGKTSAQNWEILHRLAEFHVLGRPLLVGTSRKRFLSDPLPDWLAVEIPPWNAAQPAAETLLQTERIRRRAEPPPAPAEVEAASESAPSSARSSIAVERLAATAATVAACCRAGVHVVRVHDVRAMRRVVDACRARSRPPPERAPAGI